jgi:predicted ATPase/DNA-binding SARP family transcriptional activator/Tfp pilus assembly protein PilF
MAQLSLSLFGPFHVTVGDRPVTDFDSEKVRALLAYLAVEPQPHRRTTLAGLLWPDMPEGSARHNLSQALFNLRQRIGDPTAQPPYLLISRDTLQFNLASDHTVDVTRFTTLLATCETHAHAQITTCDACATRLQQAVDLYQGPFLHQFFLSDSAAFEEWILIQREHYHRRALAALTQLAVYQEARADYATAIRMCERQLTLDPWREETHLQLMRVLALSGQRSAALSQYETCRRILADEVGVEPSAETKRLYAQIRTGELTAQPPSARSSSAAPHPGNPLTIHHLPTQLTPFVGRERELAEIQQLLNLPDCRLLTLVGAGGTGKTRLALAAAAQQRAQFAHGLAFVPLTPVVGREQAVTTIAEALGLVLYGATDRAEQLIQALQEKSLLLILDNFEHLLTDAPSVALITDLLRGAPAVKLLVTSRERLDVQPEWVFELQGLVLPEHAELPAFEASSAAQLFLQCVRRARPGFTLVAADRAAVVQICQLVEGSPLGIELAASWVRTLSCPEIAHEIQRNLDFLVTSARNVPERHRSLRAVFDSSWKLLSEEEQQVLRRLAIFRGGFRREAAESIAEASLSMLSVLVAKSLLYRTEPSRYDVHELIRQYALDHLRQDEQEFIRIQNRHSQYFAALLDRRGTAFKGAERPAVVAELTTELANIRLGWHWAATHQHAKELNQAADTLFWLYESRSNCREGVPLFGQAVQSLQFSEMLPIVPTTDAAWEQQLALAQALSYQGFFYFRQGQHPQGRERLQRSLTVLRTLAETDPHSTRAALATTLIFLGTVLAVMGEYSESRRLLDEGLGMKRALGDRWGAAFCLRQLGLAAYYAGEYTEAHRWLSESLALSREMGNTWSIAASLNLLSMATYAQGAYVEAQQLLAEGLALSKTLEDRYNIAVALNGLGLVNQALGKNEEAQQFFSEGASLWREIGDQGSLAQTLNHLGETFLAQGDPPGARQCFSQALTIAAAAQVTPVMHEALLGFATLQMQAGELASVLELVLYLLQHPASTQEVKGRAEKLRTQIEPHLTDRQRETIRAQVQQKTGEELVQGMESTPEIQTLLAS